MQPELRREVRDGTDPQDGGVRGPPGGLGVQVLLQPPVGIVNRAAQDQLVGPSLQPLWRELRQQRDRIVIQFAPADRVEFAEEGDHLRLPGPPQVASQRLQPVVQRMIGAGRSYRLHLSQPRADGGLRGCVVQTPTIDPKVSNGLLSHGCPRPCRVFVPKGAGPTPANALCRLGVRRGGAGRRPWPCGGGSPCRSAARAHSAPGVGRRRAQPAGTGSGCGRSPSSVRAGAAATSRAGRQVPRPGLARCPGRTRSSPGSRSRGGADRRRGRPPPRGTERCRQDIPGAGPTEQSAGCTRARAPAQNQLPPTLPAGSWLVSPGRLWPAVQSNRRTNGPLAPWHPLAFAEIACANAVFSSQAGESGGGWRGGWTGQPVRFGRSESAYEPDPPRGLTEAQKAEHLFSAKVRCAETSHSSCP